MLADFLFANYALADKKYSGNNPLFYGYSSSKKFQDKVNGFGDKYIRILINHIENYLSTLAIKMGMDSKMTLHLEIKDGYRYLTEQ